MATFPAIRVEGGLLGPDVLEQLLSGDLPGQKPGDFGLAARRSLTDETAAAFTDARALWGVFQHRLQRLKAEDLATGVTRDAWAIPLLGLLGYELSYNQRSYEIDGLTFALSHRAGDAEDAPPVHIVGARQELGRVAASGRPRLAPHSLVQEFLNRTEHLWGVVTNGLSLRLLRNCTFVRRQAYVEFDLPAILDENRFQDFAALYRLLHRSRLPRGLADAADCLLEQYHARSVEQGGRVREHLRDGVEDCIMRLANGFLAHPANEELRRRASPACTGNERIAADNLYRQLLRLVYRFLFLLVSEDRGLLGAEPLYRDHYGVGRLRRLVDQRAAYTDHDDLWQSLRLLWRVLTIDRLQPMLGNRTMAALLGLPVLNGELFERQDLDESSLANRDLLQAFWRLAWYQEGRSNPPRRVNYAALDVEELGSVYESLLEFHPALNYEAARQPTFRLDPGAERKTTGSYYTPPELVAELVKSALEPVLAERLKAQPKQQAKAILSLRVCDPACGSGHFLLAAARRLGKELARVQSGEDEPAPERVRAAIREVVSHCIYGVDKNPLAVDLCRVALWLESHTADKPLTFLDHRIRCGDSLVGVFDLEILKDGIPDKAFEPRAGDDRAVARALARRNRGECEGQYTLFGWDAAGTLTDLTRQSRAVDEIADDSPETIRRKRQLFERSHEDAEWLRQKQACDLWTAACFQPLTDESRAITSGTVARHLASRQPDLRVHGHAAGIAYDQRFFHWPLEFPEVFADGGFDVVLGNPPWVMPETDDRQYFAASRPEIAGEPSARARERKIEALASEAPGLYTAWVHHLRKNEAERAFFAHSGSFPHSGSGRQNYYRLFVERNWDCLRQGGRIGMIIPSGLSTNKYEQPTWHYLLKQEALVHLFDFTNTGGLFPAIDSRTKFALLSLTRAPSKRFKVGCWLKTTAEIANPARVIELTLADLETLSPGTLALPQFHLARDLDLLRAVYLRCPRFGNAPCWGHRLRLMFSSSDASYTPIEHARTADVVWLPSNRKRAADSTTLVPVYEGKMVGIYDHRQADIYLNPRNRARQAQERDVPIREKNDPLRFAIPQHWLPETLVREKRLYPEQGDWMLVFCDVTSATNERTSIPAVIPLAGLTRSMPAIYLASYSARHAALLLGALASLCLDYFARLSVSTNHLTQGIMEDLPVPELSECEKFAESLGDPDWLIARIVELSYTAWDLAPFARECGYDMPPFRWEEARRFLLQSELDAAYFHLYGVSRQDAEYVLDTFPIIRRKDEQAHGEYRTKAVVMKLYDELQAARLAGVPHKSRLTPAPASREQAHVAGKSSV